jgi:hypothetical protein
MRPERKYRKTEASGSGQKDSFSWRRDSALAIETRFAAHSFLGERLAHFGEHSRVLRKQSLVARFEEEYEYEYEGTRPPAPLSWFSGVSAELVLA